MSNKFSKCYISKTVKYHPTFSKIDSNVLQCLIQFSPFYELCYGICLIKKPNGIWGEGVLKRPLRFRELKKVWLWNLYQMLVYISRHKIKIYLTCLVYVNGFKIPLNRHSISGLRLATNSGRVTFLPLLTLLILSK